jgi:hypothetical protein
MLDWLTADQRASYAESSQFMDAPTTPAPVFAYRALKGVLFGSPGAEHDGGNNKENIPLETRSKKLSADKYDVVLKPKTSTPTRPTPRRIASPAKSILRTPGVPTPRRQNVSVKFKDIKSSSLSLETVIEGSTRKGTIMHQLPHSMTKNPAPSAPEGRDTAERATKAQSENVEPPPETFYNAKEIEAYIAATEKEMKKLVRYGQRMREYARLSQRENAGLKRELEHIRKESEKLRPNQNVGSSRGKATNDAAKAELFDISPPSKQLPKAVTGELATSPWRGINQLQKPSLPTLDASPGSAARKSQEDRNDGSLSPPLLEVPQADVGPPASSTLPRNNARAASRVQLPPDRLAAAKARLRKKSEERRKVLGVIEQSGKEEHASSMVDWQNL